MSFLLLFSVICHICASQIVREIFIGSGTSCKGINSVDGENKQIQYDLSELYNSNGNLIPDSGVGSTISLRMSICGHMTSEKTSCGDSDDRWCFEEVNEDGTCIAGIANWEDGTSSGSSIEYTAMFTSNSISEETRSGIRVTVLDYGQYSVSCPRDYTTVSYNILCAANTNWTDISLSQNSTICLWNVTLRSQHACFDVIDVDTGLSPSNLSAGSVFVIILMVVLLTYCILGCAYNSFYHGRVGMDAVPNREKWLQFSRYTRVGCEVTRDAACCSKSDSPYQEL